MHAALTSRAKTALLLLLLPSLSPLYFSPLALSTACSLRPVRETILLTNDPHPQVTPGSSS